MNDDLVHRFTHEGEIRVEYYPDEGVSITLVGRKQPDDDRFDDQLGELLLRGGHDLTVARFRDGQHLEPGKLGRCRIVIEQLEEPEDDPEPPPPDTREPWLRGEPPCTCGSENNQHAPGCMAWGNMKLPGGN